MSPKKKVKSVFVANDDKNVKQILDKSSLKEVVFTNKLTNGLQNGFNDSNEDTDEDNEEDIGSDEDNGQKLSPFKNIPLVSDNYFMAQSIRSKSSKNLFSKVIQNFDLSEEKINEIIEKQFVSQRKQLIDSYVNKNYFKKWFNLLNCGFNGLLYGVGSKHKLIELFVSECLQLEHHIVINGYNNEINIKHITSVLCEPIEETISDEMKLMDKLEDIDFDLYIVIHSIDVLFANNPKIKSYFTQLVSNCSRLRIIGSVDHINSGLLWSAAESNVYKWFWFNVPTFESYTVEKAFSANLSVLGSASKSWTQSVTYSSIKHVYDSLTNNAQKIFLLILSHFVGKDESNNGFSFTDCYTLCREEFLVNSEMTLRAQLSEFKDHQLLKLKKGGDGGEVIAVCIDKTVAKKFIESHQ